MSHVRERGAFCCFLPITILPISNSRATAECHCFSHLHCSTKLTFKSITHSCKALIDSGAEQSFLDAALTNRLGLPQVLLHEPLQMSALNGSLLAEITHHTQEITLVLSGNHVEKICLFLFKSPNTLLVLGYPWLKQHNPQIDWSQGRVSGWSVWCHEHYLRSAVPNLAQTALADPVQTPDLSAVPAEYHNLAKVFSKDLALSLPPHRPYDCGTDLLPGAPLPTSRLYSISKPERESLERYITSRGRVLLC